MTEVDRPGGERAEQSTERVVKPWHPRNWPLRTKLAVVLILPACTALAFGGLRVVSEVQNAANYQRVVDQVDVQVDITEVVHQLQTERALVVTRVAIGATDLGSESTISTQFSRTDSAIVTLGEDVAKLDLPNADSQQRYQLAYDQLRQLPALRRLAEGAVYPDLAVMTSYNTLIDPLVQLGREIEPGEGGPSRAAIMVQAIDQAKERAAQLDAVLLIAAQHNSFLAAGVQNLARSAQASFDASIADFTAVATPDEFQTYSDGYSGPDVDRRRGIAQVALANADPTAPIGTDASQLASTSAAANEKLRAVERSLIAELRGQAAAAADDASTAAWRDAAIVAGLLALALLLMFGVALTLLRLLRTLRREALAVANTRLPATVQRILDDPDPVRAAETAVEPISLHTKEEIGQVARSFDEVHRQAVRMATEHAVLRDSINAMFVNLSRRSQALIERQLSELDQLEQNELDADQLRRLFVIDHLAARMRRNSESLLILSGSGLAKRMGRPVAIGEVIESALSEVEHYQRVKVKPGPENRILGNAVKDLVHVLAELLDNAATFSASDTTVEVTSGRIRKTGELAIQIVDHGMGMAEEELDEANRQLVDPPRFDVSLSRRMGLYVVARLSQRHGIKVRLHGDLDAGVVAVITLPAHIVIGPDPNATTDPRLGSGPISMPGTGPLTGSRTGPQSMSPVPPVPPVSQTVPQHHQGELAMATRSQPLRPATQANRGSGWFPGGGGAVAEETDQRTGDWTTPSDQGWQTVRTRMTPDGAAQQLTSSGLPKRAPSGRLLPGGFTGSQPAQAGSPQGADDPRQRAADRRTPDAVRARLAGFQQGLQRARREEHDDRSGYDNQRGDA